MMLILYSIQVADYLAMYLAKNRNMNLELSLLFASHVMQIKLSYFSLFIIEKKDLLSSYVDFKTFLVNIRTNLTILVFHFLIKKNSFAAE